jgi:hypothetical protein
VARTSVAIFLAAIAAAGLAPAASAVPITYVVDRTLPSNFFAGTISVVGTVTVDDAGPTVTDWDVTIASTALGRSVTLDPGNSIFISMGTVLTATATKLVVDVSQTDGIWGPELRAQPTDLRHEWFVREVFQFSEQASIDFANPDPDKDFAGGPRTNPTILHAVPEPAVLSAAALAVLAALARRGPRSAR